jgi:hypothetical protein
MNTTKSLVILAFVSTTLLGACASTGRERANAAMMGMKATRTSIDNLIKASDDGVAALNVLATTGMNTPTASYNKFCADLEIIENEVSAMRSRQASMKANTTAFFKGWEEEMGAVKNAQIKQLAAERRKSLEESYDKVKVALDQLKKDGNPYLDDLKDLKTYFDIDLTPAGITASKPLIATVTELSTVVKKDLQDLGAQIKNIEDLLAPTMPQPAK